MAAEDVVEIIDEPLALGFTFITEGGKEFFVNLQNFRKLVNEGQANIGVHKSPTQNYLLIHNVHG